jgi:hypothetical protein
VTNAQCWAHSRRGFFEAQGTEPQAAAEALRQIGELYDVEREIRKRKLSGENKRLHRLTHSKPLVEAFFDWVDRQFEQQGLLPSNPLTKALAYVRDRRAGLEVFLGDPDVPMDTNHLERALRAIPMGRRNWLVCGWPWHLEVTWHARDHCAHVEHGRSGLVEGGGIRLSLAQLHRAGRIRHRASGGNLSPAACVDLVEPSELSLRAATCGAASPRCGCSTASAAA